MTGPKIGVGPGEVNLDPLGDSELNLTRETTHHDGSFPDVFAHTARGSRGPLDSTTVTLDRKGALSKAEGLPRDLLQWEQPLPTLISWPTQSSCPMPAAHGHVHLHARLNRAGSLAVPLCLSLRLSCRMQPLRVRDILLRPVRLLQFKSCEAWQTAEVHLHGSVPARHPRGGAA